MKSVGDALFTTSRKKILGLLFTQPEKSFYTKEIIRLSNMGVATIKRELDNLLESEIITMTKIGNQHHYQANPDCPVYSELFSLIKKTFGIVGTLQQALSESDDKINWAFIFGSIASGKETSSSDIDLMIIGNIGFSEAVSLFYPFQEILGREINPKIYSTDEWIQMKESAFIQEVLAKPKINVIGDGNGLG
jgi:predicted nucleotidyltransferase